MSGEDTRALPTAPAAVDDQAVQGSHPHAQPPPPIAAEDVSMHADDGGDETEDEGRGEGMDVDDVYAPTVPVADVSRESAARGFQPGMAEGPAATRPRSASTAHGGPLPAAILSTPPAPPRRTSPPGSGPSEEAAALLLNFSAVADHPLPPIAEHSSYPHTPPQDSPNSVVRAGTASLPPQVPSSPSGLPTPTAPSPDAPAKPAAKPKRKRNAVAGPSRHTSTEDPAANERPPHWMGADNTVIRCICGLTEDDGFTVLCERCNAWEHALCFGFRDDALLPEVFLCELCNPRPLPFSAEMARSLQLQARASYEARRGVVVRPVEEVVVEQKKSRPKTKRPRTESIRREPEPTPVESGEEPLKDPTGMAPPLTKPKRRSQTGKPRSKTNDSSSYPNLISGQEDEDYFRILPWELEYTPLKDNVIRGRATRHAMTQLYHEWVEEDETAPPRKSAPRPAYHDSGLPSPTDTGLRLSPDPTLMSPPDFSALAPPVPPVFINGNDLSALEAPTTIRPIEESACYLPLKYIEPSSGVYPRPTIYGVFAIDQIAAGGFIGEYRGEVLDAASYRKDPINQYAALGVPKPYVHSIGPPVNLILDARSYGCEMRFVRNGCHPNAVIRPLFFRADDSSCAKLRFGIFASRDLAKNEEVVLGWEWDDQHVVHTLRTIIDLTLKSSAGQPVIPPETVELLTTKFDSILTNIFGTFQSCACTVTMDCAFSQMRRLVAGQAFHGVSGQRARKPIDIGELIGAVRGWRRRELEEAAAAKARRYRSSGEWEVWRAGPSKDLEEASRAQSENAGSEDDEDEQEEDEDEQDDEEPADEAIEVDEPEIPEVKPLVEPEPEPVAQPVHEVVEEPTEPPKPVATPAEEPAVEVPAAGPEPEPVKAVEAPATPEAVSEPIAAPIVEPVPEPVDPVDPDETDDESPPMEIVEAMQVEEAPFKFEPAAEPEAAPEPQPVKPDTVAAAEEPVKAEPAIEEAAQDEDVVMEETKETATAVSLAPSSSALSSIDLPSDDKVVPLATATPVEEEGEDEIGSGNESDATTVTIVRSQSEAESEADAAEEDVRPPAAVRRGRRVLSPTAESSSHGASSSRSDKPVTEKPAVPVEVPEKPKSRARLVPTGKVVSKAVPRSVARVTAAKDRKRPRPRKNVIASSDEDDSDGATADSSVRSPKRPARPPPKKVAKPSSSSKKRKVEVDDDDDDDDVDAEEEVVTPAPKAARKSDRKPESKDKDTKPDPKSESSSKPDKAESTRKADKSERGADKDKPAKDAVKDTTKDSVKDKRDKDRVADKQHNKAEKLHDMPSKRDKTDKHDRHDKKKGKVDRKDKTERAQVVDNSAADKSIDKPTEKATGKPADKTTTVQPDTSVEEPAPKPTKLTKATPKPTEKPVAKVDEAMDVDESPADAPAPPAKEKTPEPKEPTPPPKEATPPPKEATPPAKEPTPPPKEPTPPPKEPTPPPKEPTPPPKEPPPPPKEPTPPPPKKVSMKEYLASHKIRKVSHPIAPPEDPVVESPIEMVKEKDKEPERPTEEVPVKAKVETADVTPAPPSVSTHPSRLNLFEHLPSARAGSTTVTPLGTPFTPTAPTPASEVPTPSAAYVPRTDYFPNQSVPLPAPSFAPRPSPSYVPRTLHDESPSSAGGGPPHPSPSYVPRQSDNDVAVSPLAIRPPLPAQTPPRPSMPLPDMPPAIGSRDGPPHHTPSYGPRAPPTGPRIPPTGPRGSWGGPGAGPVSGANASGGPVSPVAPLRGGPPYPPRGGGFGMRGGFGDRGGGPPWRGRGGFRGRGRGM